MLFKSIIRHWNCFLSSAICNAWQGLKWIETWKSWANLFKYNASKHTKKLLRLVLPYKNLISSLQLYKSILCLGKKRNAFTAENLPKTAMSLWHADMFRLKGKNQGGGTVWLLSGRGGISCAKTWIEKKFCLSWKKKKKKIGKSKSHWITTLAQILQSKIRGLLIYLNLGFSLSFLTKYCFHWGTPRFVLTYPLTKSLAFGFHTQQMNVVRVKGINYRF